jgi:L-fuculose-phosphate aldolase
MMSVRLRPEEEIVATMQRIYGCRMTTSSGGNLSIRDEAGDLWITPARVDKGTLRAEDVVCVRGDGVVAGRHPASSELPLHLAIYEARPELRAILHAHSTALVAFSLARQTPETRLTAEARRICGAAGFAAFELPGSSSLGRRVAGAFSSGCNAVILENHGVVTAGGSLEEAFQRFETLETVAQTVIRARLLGGEVRYLSDAQIEQGREAILRLALPADGTGPDGGEEEARRVLSEFVRRAYRQRLFTSAQGCFSARLAAGGFLITPDGGDRGGMEGSALVRVDADQVAHGGKPDAMAAVHAAIYRAQPAVGAVIAASPVNAMAFAAAGAELDARTIPESYWIVRRPGRIGYGTLADPEAAAGAISLQNPVLLIENGGAMVAGRDVLQAFDRMEVLESTAETLINLRAVGELSPLPAGVLAQLDLYGGYS